MNQEQSESNKSSVMSYPAPEGEQPSDLYKLKINGTPVFVYEARVSARPENQAWPGYQRPLDQTELAGFAYWDMTGPVEIEIESKRPLEQVIVRPLALGIKPLVESNTISFTINDPAPVVVEINDFHGALHLFPSPSMNPPPGDNPGVKYFGPGIHNAGRIVLKDNETVYIAGGAVVHGVINAENAQNIRVTGRGILDASSIERGAQKNMLWFEKCRDVLVSGIILRDPHVWAAKPTNCDGVRFENVKLIGCWRYNSDGLDFLDCRDVLVSKCFVRSFDDSIIVKSFGGGGTIHDITVEDCVVWTDWGISLGITYETRTDSIRNVTFRNCDILHNIACRGALTLNPNDRSPRQESEFHRITRR